MQAEGASLGKRKVALVARATSEIPHIISVRLADTEEKRLYYGDRDLQETGEGPRFGCWEISGVNTAWKKYPPKKPLQITPINDIISLMRQSTPYVSPSVRQSVSPSVRQSVSPSVRQSVSPSTSPLYSEYDKLRVNYLIAKYPHTISFSRLGIKSRIVQYDIGFSHKLFLFPHDA